MKKLDSGNRLAGQNLWFAVTGEMLIKIAKMEQRINELEMKVRELEEKLDDHLAWHIGASWAEELEEGRS